MIILTFPRTYSNIKFDWFFWLTAIYFYPKPRFPASVPRKRYKPDEPCANNAGKVMFNHGVIAAAPEKVLKIKTNATEYRSTLMMK